MIYSPHVTDQTATHRQKGLLFVSGETTLLRHVIYSPHVTDQIPWNQNPLQLGQSSDVFRELALKERVGMSVTVSPIPGINIDIIYIACFLYRVLCFTHDKAVAIVPIPRLGDKRNWSVTRSKAWSVTRGLLYIFLFSTNLPSIMSIFSSQNKSSCSVRSLFNLAPGNVVNKVNKKKRYNGN